MELSILIPARNEEFLSRTVQDLLDNIEADTEIIVVLDGKWADPPLPVHERLNVVYLPESIGQRAATNLACRLARGKYVAKTDAHCAFDKGFDRKLIADMRPHWTVVPTMRNLHAFNWVCKCGETKYQDKVPKCDKCSSNMTKDVVWIAKKRPQSNSYCFDSEPHFQYFNEFSKRPEGKGDLTESMSLQGSFFMMTKDKYWEHNICDESIGSWGSQGIEVACKTWLSGGRVIVNHKTWYAHMFRTKPENGFGFPYEQPPNMGPSAKAKARDLFFNNKWPKAKKPISWLIEKFWPVKGWTEQDLNKLKKGTNDIN